MAGPSPRRSALPAAAGLAGAAALAALAGWLATVSLQQDFAAYDTAARTRAQGLDPYVNQLPAGGPWDGVAVYRHSRFLYPPLVAELFRPLAALPFAWAKALFTAASALALALGLHLALGDAAGAPAASDWRRTACALAVAAAWPPVFAALERGQLDLLLFPLLAAAWRWRDRPARAGMALALCALGKPLVAGVLPLLVVAGRWRWAAATAAALLLLALASLALDGPALNARYLTEVLPRAARYGEGGPEAWLLDAPALAAVSGELEGGTATVGGRTYAQQVGDFPRSASLARAVAGRAGAAAGTAATLLVLLGGGALMALAARGRAGGSAWYWGGLLVALLAAPVSWAMGLVWALPLVGALPRMARAGARAPVLALAATWAAGMLGPWLGGAWIASGVAGVAAALLAARATRPAHEAAR